MKSKLPAYHKEIENRNYISDRTQGLCYNPNKQLKYLLLLLILLN